MREVAGISDLQFYVLELDVRWRHYVSGSFVTENGRGLAGAIARRPVACAEPRALRARIGFIRILFVIDFRRIFIHLCVILKRVRRIARIVLCG